jgi:hypothetical protein
VAAQASPVPSTASSETQGSAEPVKRARAAGHAGGSARGNRALSTWNVGEAWPTLPPCVPVGRLALLERERRVLPLRDIRPHHLLLETPIRTRPLHSHATRTGLTIEKRRPDRRSWRSDRQAARSTIQRTYHPCRGNHQMDRRTQKPEGRSREGIPLHHIPRCTDSR